MRIGFTTAGWALVLDYLAMFVVACVVGLYFSFLAGSIVLGLATVRTFLGVGWVLIQMQRAPKLST